MSVLNSIPKERNSLTNTMALGNETRLPHRAIERGAEAATGFVVLADRQERERPIGGSHRPPRQRRRSATDIQLRAGGRVVPRVSSSRERLVGQGEHGRGAYLGALWTLCRREGGVPRSLAGDGRRGDARPREPEPETLHEPRADQGAAADDGRGKMIEASRRTKFASPRGSFGEPGWSPTGLRHFRVKRGCPE